MGRTYVYSRAEPPRRLRRASGRRWVCDNAYVAACRRDLGVPFRGASFAPLCRQRLEAVASRLPSALCSSALPRARGRFLGVYRRQLVEIDERLAFAARGSVHVLMVMMWKVGQMCWKERRSAFDLS